MLKKNICQDPTETLVVASLLTVLHEYTFTMPMPKVASKTSLFFDIMTEDDELERIQKVHRASLSLSRSTNYNHSNENGGDPPNNENCTSSECDGANDRAGVREETSIQDRPQPSFVISPEEMLREFLGDLYVDFRMLQKRELLGEGGFATVHRCSLVDPHSGASRDVAMKVLKPDLLTNAEDLKEFLMEANLQRKLKHKHIVKIIGIGSTDFTDLSTMRRSMFFLQEFMDGGSLKDIVLKQMLNKHVEVYSMHEAWQWLIEVAHALHYLHNVCRPAIIHRDLKLDNILLCGNPRVAKLCDFGLHKRLRWRMKSSENLSIAPNAFKGSLDPYMAGPVGEGSYYGGTLYMSTIHGGREFGSLERISPMEQYGKHPPSPALAKDTAPLPNGVPFSGIAKEGGDFSDIVDSGEGGAVAGWSEKAHGGEGYLKASGSGDLIAPLLVSAESSGIKTGVCVKNGSTSSLQAIPNNDSSDSLLDALTSAGRSFRKIMGEVGKSLSRRSGASSNAGLTQKVGSTIYMAPEVISGQKYNEKVDIFSFAVIMYELLTQNMILAKYAMVGEPTDLPEYAEKVAKGHREVVPEFWPTDVKDLVTDCWAQSAKDRPTFQEVLSRLLCIKESGFVDRLSRPRAKGYSPLCDCGCSIQ